MPKIATGIICRDACCRLMAWLDEALYRYVMDCRKLHTDDTPVPAPGRKKTKAAADIPA